MPLHDSADLADRVHDSPQLALASIWRLEDSIETQQVTELTLVPTTALVRVEDRGHISAVVLHLGGRIHIIGSYPFVGIT